MNGKSAKYNMLFIDHEEDILLIGKRFLNEKYYLTIAHPLTNERFISISLLYPRVALFILLIVDKK